MGTQAGETPHFKNDVGAQPIFVGAKEFMCIGAAPPFDHPHVFLNMGGGDEVVCSYCSTLFRLRADLAPGETDPPGCVWEGARPA